MILLVKNLLTVIATDFALQIIVSTTDNAIRITFDIHAIIRVLSSIRIFPSAFYPPSAFSHPRFILHPHFLIRVLSSIRIFSSAFYLHPHFLIRVLSSIRIFSSVFSHPPSVSAIRIRVLSIPVPTDKILKWSALALLSARSFMVLLLWLKLAIDLNVYRMQPWMLLLGNVTR